MPTKQEWGSPLVVKQDVTREEGEIMLVNEN